MSTPWDSSWPSWAGPEAVSEITGYLGERFGFASHLFSDYRWLVTKESWWLVRNSEFLREAGRLKVSRVGMKAVSRVGAFIKPTTRFAQAFGHAASRAKVTVDRVTLARLIEGRTVPLDLDLEPGYVILALPGDCVLGMGLYLNGTLRSQLPRKELHAAMFSRAPDEIIHA
ncbi:MAG: hypothetical protein JRJ35_08315 [Deltaproteobacteria bacterium]|nr:hypothetical protein [Deltaproteobacteria bacterium]MBW1949616.1 hypothetical protein [Deltaproteobacteria bacterium]MBW2007808.1 hypothetical protein [Deltaproteobacteria bacterium]